MLGGGEVLLTDFNKLEVNGGTYNTNQEAIKAAREHYNVLYGYDGGVTLLETIHTIDSKLIKLIFATVVDQACDDFFVCYLRY